jgi:tetratricopeptide (TPR) repeat protein
MKKFNLNVVVSMVMVALLLSGCASIKKMKKNANLIKWDVTPEVLETHAGQVQVAVEGQIPEKYFAKKANLLITPVMKYEGGEKAYPEIKLQGEKVTANNLAIVYKKGGNFSVKGSIPYEAAMKMSELQIRIVASQGAKSLDFEPVKIADGVIATSELVSKVGEPIFGIIREKNTTGKYNPAIDAFQRVVPDELMADIHYLINKADVSKNEAASKDIADFNAYAKDALKNDRKELKSLEISAYASPDGSEEINTKLSQEREKSATDFFNKNLKTDNLSTTVKTKYTAEDWDGFQKLISESKIQDKELILRVLSMYSDPEVREKEIRNLSEAFTNVADQILPQLRRAKFIADVNLIGKTDAELLAAAENKPESLNQAELIQATILTDDNAKKLQFSKSFTKQFPDDWRGYNNLGMAQVKAGDFASATANFEKADKLNQGNPIIQNNLGVAALYNGETNKAKEYFAAASGLGKEVEHNMGIVSILRAEYDKAVKYFGDSTSPNAGLAKILAGDNNGALKTLEAGDASCPMNQYLKAVVGARSGKEELLIESLTKSCQKDASFKAAAKTDLEFAKYFENPKFKAIVE